MLRISSLAIRVIVRLSAVATIVSAASGQAKWQHPYQASAYGNGAFQINGYSSGINRSQQILDPAGFNASGTMVFRSVAHRKDRGAIQATGVPVTMAMWISLTPPGVTSQNASSTFASNIDAASRVQVLARRKIVLPTLFDNSFATMIKFDRQYLYPGVASRRSLCVETRVYGNAVNDRLWLYELDGLYSAPSGKHSTNGVYKGCSAANTRRPELDVTPQHLHVGGTKNFLLGAAWVPNLPAVVAVGTQPANVPLPGGCRLMQDILFFPTLGEVTEPGNSIHRWPLPIPDVPALRSRSFLAQAFWLQPKANALGLISSQSLKCTIADELPIFVSTHLKTRGVFPQNPDTFTVAREVTSNLGLVYEFRN